MNPLDLHVLVVDDEPDARELLGLVLERAVRRVELAGSAREAIGMIARNPPDVLVSDICMPGEDGRSLVRRMRALPEQKQASVPAIAVTALTSALEIAQARAAGFDVVLAKPVDTATLLDALRAVSDAHACPGSLQPPSPTVKRMRGMSSASRVLRDRAGERNARTGVVLDRARALAHATEALLHSAARILAGHGDDAEPDDDPPPDSVTRARGGRRGALP